MYCKQMELSNTKKLPGRVVFCYTYTRTVRKESVMPNKKLSDGSEYLQIAKLVCDNADSSFQAHIEASKSVSARRAAELHDVGLPATFSEMEGLQKSVPAMRPAKKKKTGK